MISRLAVFVVAVSAAAQSTTLPSEYAGIARFLEIEKDVETLLSPACADPTTTVHCLGARTRIVGSILLAQLEISTVASVLEREEKRAQQRADALTRQLASRVRRRTTWLILVGAVGVIVSAALNSQSAAIATGVTEAAMGVSILRLNEQEPFEHSVNPLRELWREELSGGTFPPGLWAYLLRPSSDGVRTIRQELIDTWMKTYEVGRATNEGRRLETLLLSNGGVYTPDDLRIRVNMLGQLQATISGVEERLVQFQKSLLRSRDLPARE